MKSGNPEMNNEEGEEEEEEGDEFGNPTYPLTSELLAASQEPPPDYHPPVREMKLHHRQGSTSNAKAKEKNCPEFHPTYDPRQLVEISLHLDVLKNFALEVPPTPGQFLIRVCLHDDAVYHSLSHSTLGPATPFNHSREAPDIIVDDEICLKYRFKDIIDNPIFLRLIDIKGIELTPETDLSVFIPFGYICLDVASLLKYQNGYIEQHTEPWIITDPEVESLFLNGRPLLQVNIECKEGMPTKAQLRQGNLATFFVGSMYHVPEDVIPFVKHQDADPKLDVILTFPHSGKHPFLHFKEGQYNDTIFREPPVTALSEMDEATQTKDPDSFFQRTEEINRYAPPRHWASILEHNKGIPIRASAVSVAEEPPREDPNEEVYGDAADLYKVSMDQRRYCEEPIVEWNSQHIRYIPVESYKKMLSRLSHEVIWPMEVVMTIKRPENPKETAEMKGYTSRKHSDNHKDKEKSNRKSSLKKKSKKSGKGKEYDNSDSGNTGDDGGDGGAEEIDFQYLNALGESNPPDRVIVYHGIAFVNLSQLVNPGQTKVRFASKVYPFSPKLLERFTCLTKSAVETVLPYAHEAPEIFGDLVVRRRSSKEVGKCHPFIVLEVEMKRSIVPLFKALNDIPDVVHDYIQPREIPRRRLVSADTTKKRFKQAVVNCAGEIANEFSNHFWKEVVLQGKKMRDGSKTPFPSSVNLQALKKAFVFYLNASGRYLVLREHLREAVTQFVQQRCLDMKKDSLEFNTHRDFHSFLSDMYIHLCDEVHETLSETALQEPDPLDPIPNPPTRFCSEVDAATPEAPLPHKEYEKRSLLRNLLFYSEESLAQGDFENCQRLHLQRICVSKEDSSCWTDYGISWLSRGDHRMAEIALKEAIRQNPNNIYVLLLGGLMSVLYNDERGIDCLTVALGMRPSCPEIMVLLALAYAQLGNEIAADYFFRRAAFFHRVLTGRSTVGVDEKIDELSKSVGIKQSLQNLGNLEESLFPPEGTQAEKKKTEKEVKMMNKGKGAKEVNKGKGKNDKRKKDQSPGGKGNNNNNKPGTAGSNSKGSKGEKSKSKTAVGGKSKKSKSPGKGGGSSGGGSSGQSRQSSAEATTAPPPPPNPSHSISIELRRFDFSAETKSICLSEVYLPGFSPSIRIPWNVTEFDEKIKAHLDELEGNGKIPTGESKISPDDEIKLEFDKMMEQERSSSANSSSGADPTLDKAYEIIKRSSTIVNKEKKNPGKKSKKGSGAPGSGGGRGSSGSGSKSQRQSSQRDSGAGASPITVEDYEESEDVEGLFPLKRSQEGQRRLLEKKLVDKAPEMYDDRLGSELIWAAQLLLQLRMFDLLDGVLARELLIAGKRSLQFLYLRGMSNYMRQKQSSALFFFDEGLKIDPENSILWMLKGHCLYETGDHIQAAVAYEKALHLPVGKENRHLLYLRYGTLSLEAGNWEIAKKVFLHGVQKYPTPYMWLAIGNTCYALKEYDQAEVAFAEANRLDNTDPITWAHLSLVNLAQNQRVLAEQSYKWALRFGLKKGKILDEIKRLQEEKGFGDPSFPRVPNCIPHDYFVRRLGRQKPFDMYRDALMNEQPSLGRPRFDDTDREKELKAGILKIAQLQGNIPPPEEAANEEEMENEEEEMNASRSANNFLDPNSIVGKSADSKNQRKKSSAVGGGGLVKTRSKINTTGGNKKQGKNSNNNNSGKLRKSHENKSKRSRKSGRGSTKGGATSISEGHPKKAQLK